MKRKRNTIKLDGQKHSYSIRVYQKCCRCGNSKYESDDINCPALGKTCYSGGKAGHYKQYCKSQVVKKRKLDVSKDTKQKGQLGRVEDKRKQILKIAFLIYGIWDVVLGLEKSKC